MAAEWGNERLSEWSRSVCGLHSTIEVEDREMSSLTKETNKNRPILPILIAHQAHHPLIIFTPHPGVAVLRVRDLSLPSLGKHDRARGVPEDDPTMTKDTKENMFEKSCTKQTYIIQYLCRLWLYIHCSKEKRVLISFDFPWSSVCGRVWPTKGF